MATPNTEDALGAAAEKAFAAPFGGVLLLAPDDGIAIWIDGRESLVTSAAQCPNDTTADCVLRGGRETLLRALASTRAFESAFVSGRIAVAGDMSVMARLTIKEVR